MPRTAPDPQEGNDPRIVGVAAAPASGPSSAPASGPPPSMPFRGAGRIPNALSVGRLAASPIVVALLLWAPAPRWIGVVAAALFALASITDYLDGYLARRWRVTSRFGALCDLMADKLLVASTLIALVGIGYVPAWMTIVIVGRELVVSGLRSWAAERGADIPAGIWGKSKTAVTLVAIVVTILAHTWVFSGALLLVATLLTLLSALDYLMQAWRVGRASS